MIHVRDETLAMYSRFLRGEITREQFASAKTKNGVIVEDTTHKCDCKKPPIIGYYNW